MRKIICILTIFLVIAGNAAADIYTGKVFSKADGKPVVGADVIAFRYCEGFKEKVETRTGEFGKFEVELPAITKTEGEYLIGEVYEPGYVPGRFQITSEVNIVRLEPGGQLWGTVMDEKKNPVAGAEVQLIDVKQSNGNSMSYSCSMFYKNFTTKTTADGRWTITGVPITGTASVRLSDPRFVNTFTRAEMGPDAGPAPPLTARPGAVIEGRVLTPDGKPASKLTVFTASDISGTGLAGTGDDGSYRLEGLSSGIYGITIEGSIEYVASMLTDIKAEEGKTVKAPDIILSKGVIIEGTITEEGTGRPRPGIRLHVSESGTNRTARAIYAESDENGRYTVRVPAGEFEIQLYNKGGHGRPEPYIKLDTRSGKKQTLDIRVAKEVVVTGKIVDEDGSPLPGRIARMIVTVDEFGSGTGADIRSDENGNFTVRDMVSGNARLTLLYCGAGDEWEIVEPSTFELPLSKPLVIKMHKAEHLSISGKVVTNEGNPVSGAVVRLDFQSPSYVSFAFNIRSETLTTGTEGTFTYDRIRENEELKISASKPNYRYVTGGEVKKENGTFTVSDIVMQKLNAEVEGRVTDSEGKPVAGAKVTSPQGDSQATTDSDGRFKMQSVPEGEITLLAFHGHSSGRATYRTGEGSALITIKPARNIEPGDIQLGYQILEEALNAHKDESRAAAIEMSLYDPELALKLAVSPDGSIPDYALAGIAATLADKNPEEAVKLLPRIEKINDRHLKLYALTELGISIAKTDPALAAELYSKAITLIGRRDKLGEFVSDYCNLITLSILLKNGESENLLDEMLSDARFKNPANEIDKVSADGWLENAGEMLAKVDPQMARRVVLKMNNPRERTGALASVARITAKYDLNTALGFLEEIKTMDSSPSLSYTLGEVSPAIVRIIGMTDPNASLEYARNVDSHKYRAVALAAAAESQNKLTAAEVLREAMYWCMTNFESTDYAARIAAQAYQTDPSLGKELFGMILNSEVKSSFRLSPAEIAFYYMEVYPSESAVMLQKYIIHDGENNSSNNAHGVMALVPFDMDLAFDAIKNDKDKRRSYEHLTAVARYVMAGEDDRKHTEFEFWSYGIQPDLYRPKARGLTTWDKRW